MFECAHCGKPITKLFFHDGNCYGSTCIKRLFNKSVVKRAQWISIEDLPILAQACGVTIKVETLRIPRWCGKRAHLSNGNKISFNPSGNTWIAHAETVQQALS